MIDSICSGGGPPNFCSDGPVQVEHWMSGLLAAIDGFFVQPILTLLIWVIFINVILSWLVQFDIVNLRNRFVAAVLRVTDDLTRPLLAPIRRVLPKTVGVDFAPFVLLLIVYFTRNWLAPTLLR